MAMNLIIDTLDRTARARGDAPALKYKQDRRWQTTSWREYREQIRLAARALIAIGVTPGEHVTIIGFNCPEWFVADVGAIAAGAIPAGIYTTNTPEQCQYVAAHCQARVVFAENAEQLAKFTAIREQLPDLLTIVVMHGEPDVADAISWKQFLSMGQDVPDEALDERIAAQKPDDVC